MSTRPLGGSRCLIMTAETELEVAKPVCGIFGFGLPCLNATAGVELGLGTGEFREEFPS